MNRSLSILVGLIATVSLGTSLASCNAPSCGPGTVQAQQKNGELKCVPVDSPDALTPCDTDGGNVVIVGGKCVSAISCDPATTMNENGVCVGIQGGPVGCKQPAPGKACVYGNINDFKTGMANAVTPLHIELFDAIGLLNGMPPIAMTDLTTSGGSYVFQDFTPPTFGLIVVLTGRTNATMTAAGTGAQSVVGDGTYRVDAYAIQKADSDKWGFDVTAGGAYVGKYYKDMKPAPNLLIANEMMKASGVTLTKDGSAAGAKYFDDTLTMIDTTLTATGNSGVGIVASPIPMGGMFPNFSGTGGGVSPWETLPGGSAPNIVIITRFHPM